MNLRRPSLACALAGLSLTLLPAPARAADTPAVAAVRHFLEARAAGRYDEAYKLLLFGAGTSYSAKQFAAGVVPPPDAEKQAPPAVFAMDDLFADTHNTRKYTFEVAGADPSDPSVVLVRATPPAGAAPVTLRMVTELDSAHVLRVSVLKSFSRAAPREVGEAARRDISLSNIRQLALGVLEYQEDHDMLMPDADKWADEIMPYIRDKGPFRDPAAPAGTAYGYAFNRALSHKSLAVIESPATTVLLFESTKGVKNASDLGQSVPRPGRHQGRTNYAFVDGHAQSVADGTKLSFKLTGK